MDSFANTPRRVTRASLAAMSASKNTPNNHLVSPAPAKKTPAGTKKTVGQKTPLAASKTPVGTSTGKPRGRPKKTPGTAKTNEESKENHVPIPSVTVADDDTKKYDCVRKILNLVNPGIDAAEENNVQIQSETENVSKAPEDLLIPEIQVTEASFMNEMDGEKTEIPTLAEHGKAIFDETLNFSKLEGKMEEKAQPEVITGGASTTFLASPQTENPNFDETLAFSKLEENCASEEKSSNETNANHEEMDIDNKPDSEDNMNNKTIFDATMSVEVAKEDNYIAQLCAEAESDVQESFKEVPIVGSVSDIESTLNGTFEVDDSVFAPDIPEPADVEPVSVTKPNVPNIVYDTIVVEDTPLKPKTPQVTMRRKLKKQQHVEKDVSDVLSVSCAVAEKSILKRKKRSLSTGDINSTMQERRVKFNSPANMTLQINEIDERMMKTFTATNGRHQRK